MKLDLRMPKCDQVFQLYSKWSRQKKVRLGCWQAKKNSIVIKNFRTTQKSMQPLPLPPLPPKITQRRREPKRCKKCHCPEWDPTGKPCFYAGRVIPTVCHHMWCPAIGRSSAKYPCDRPRSPDSDDDDDDMSPYKLHTVTSLMDVAIQTIRQDGKMINWGQTLAYLNPGVYAQLSVRETLPLTNAERNNIPARFEPAMTSLTSLPIRLPEPPQLVSAAPAIYCSLHHAGASCETLGPHGVRAPIRRSRESVGAIEVVIPNRGRRWGMSYSR